MSNHFTYEINERNLKMKLKDLEFPLDEALVQRFEELSHAQLHQTGSKGLVKFSIPIGSNVTLPLVFGGLVLLFSLLLFNFISIKNPAEKNITEPIPGPDIPSPQIQQTALPSTSGPSQHQVQVPPSDATRQKETEVVKEKLKQPESSPSTNPLVAKQTPPAPVSAMPTTAATNTPAQQPLPMAKSMPAVTGTSTATPATPGSTVNVTSKRKQRREAPDVMDSNTTDSRPAVTELDRETPSRPN